MSDTPEQGDLPPDDSTLAAEYVLRLLPHDQERAFAARLANDPALTAEVAQWTTRLEGMNAEFTPVAPRAAVKATLQSRLFGDAPRVAFWQRLGLWQGVSFASLAVAGFMLWQGMQGVDPQSGPLYVSELSGENQELRLLAVYDSSNAELRLTRTDGSAPANRVLELWAIDGDNAPVSLGVLPDAAGSVITLPPEFRASISGLVLAITDEPPGGAPGGIPSGSVMAAGPVTEI